MKLIEELNLIKQKLLMGKISYNEAKIEAKPFIKAFNVISREKALKYGVRAKLFNFSSFIR